MSKCSRRVKARIGLESLKRSRKMDGTSAKLILSSKRGSTASNKRYKSKMMNIRNLYK
jgi:hypothetical protein